MENKKYRFSSEEIIVLAGLLGKNQIFVVNSELLFTWKSVMSQRIKTIIQQLERKSIISLKLEGQVLINKYVADMIETMCHPERVIRMQWTHENYIFSKNNQYLYVQISMNGSLRMYLSDNVLFDITQIIPFNGCQGITFSLPNTLGQTALELVNRFEEARAHQLLKDYFMDEQLVVMALDAITDNSTNVKCDFYSFCSSSFIREKHFSLICMENIVLRASADEEQIKFTYEEPEIINAEVADFLKKT